MRVMVIIKANAGVMLAGEGLHPSSKAKRIKFSRGNRTKAERLKQS